MGFMSTPQAEIVKVSVGPLQPLRMLPSHWRATVLPKKLQETTFASLHQAPFWRSVRRSQSVQDRVKSKPNPSAYVSTWFYSAKR